VQIFAQIAAALAGFFVHIASNNGAWFWYMVQAIGITVTMVLIYRQVRRQTDANALAAVHALENRWHSDTMLRARQAACTDFRHEATNIDRDIGEVLGFFEDVALYVDRNVIDVSMVWEIYSYWLIPYWTMFQPRVAAFRTARNDPTWYDKFEALSKKLAAHAKMMKAPVELPSGADLEKFISGELARARRDAA
jgi:hypothetical protein